MRVVPIRRGWLFALCAGLFLVAQAGGQPKAEPPKASAIKLPDGTIIFLTKSPDDANPPIDGVLLSAADFKALTDKSEQAKKAKIIAPSGVAIRGQIEMRGERPVAALTLIYSFRTTQPRTVIALGCQRAAVISAKSESGQLPILNPPGDDGLTAFVDSVGEHTLTLTVEVLVTTRGTKNEIGFDMGLPRCAITTLELTKPPAAGLKKLTLSTRIPEVTPPKPSEIKASSISAEALSKPLPLGATDTLELAWEKPSAPVISGTSRSIDADIAVRVEESSIETVAKLRLHGAVKEWPMQLPANAEVVVERAVPSTVGTPADTATVVRPTDAIKSTWIIRIPSDPANPEWLATITVRQLRPKAADPKYRGPYAIGPYSSPAATKQTGRIRISAPANIRLSYKPLADVGRLDLPAGADDDLLSMFQYSALPTPVGNARVTAIMELETRAAVIVPRVRPNYKLRLTAGGWQLDAVLKITPAPRGEVEQILVEMPPGWQKRLEATPEEIVESVQVVKEGAGRSLAVKFITPQKAPFELTLSSTFPISPGARELSIPLPRYPQTDERESKVSVTVAEGLEVRGIGHAIDSNQATAESLKAAPGGKVGAVTTVLGEFERGLDRVDVVWQPYRPELACEIRAEVTVQDRQTLVTQTILFKPTADDPRPVRIRGPQNAIVWQQSTPPLDPVDTVGSNEWEFRPPASSGGKEFALTVTFAVKHPSKADGQQSVRIPISLFWPESASRTETRVRVWGGTSGRRGELVNDGQWRELPPEPMPGRDTLPWFTLATSSGKVPLTLSLSEVGDSGVPFIGIERAILLAAITDAGNAICRAKFLLTKWTGDLAEIQLPHAQALEVFIDGKRADGIVPNEADLVQIPLPEARAGKSATIELRYRAPLPRGPRGVRLLPPPVIRGATLRNALRWHLGVDGGIAPLLLTRELNLELQWAWRGFGFAPSAASTPAELEQWFSAGAESERSESMIWPTAASDTIAARQIEPAALAILLLPRFGWIAAISLLAFAVGYFVSRLRVQWLSLAVGGFAIGAAIASVVVPHPVAQAFAAMQPGIAALGAFLFGKAALAGYLRRRVDHLPAFSRGGHQPAPISASAREANGSRPSRRPRELPIEATIGSRPPSASKG